ncbi:enoyl-CoA hydratase/isomerase family protein [Streptomyces sp. NPDC028722]|uniref:enoyl-CoA hydratase/isomerase family protein n=1 Tax=Streptomyces sp. NPDC028722 TaxID=3155016 RepID=UPI00340B2679
MLKDFKTLDVTHDKTVLRVRLNQPETGNAITSEMLAELLKVLRALEDDNSVRVMVLSGAGEDFCTGGDRREFPALLEQDPSGASLRALASRAQRVCAALSQQYVVTVAELHGAVIGAGLGLAVFCDLRIGTDTCRFRMPEVGLGVPPAWGGVLPRLVEEAGQAQVRRLLLTAENFGAARALELSILHEVVAPEDLEASVAKWVRPLARRDPLTLRTTKGMLNSVAAAAEAPVGLYDEELLTASISRTSLARRS